MNKPFKPRKASHTPAPAAAKPVAREVVQSQANADSTAAFLREVDEAMRVEAWQKRWQQWRLPLFAGVALLITGAAAWQGWQAWQQHTSRSVAAKWDEIRRTEDKAELTKQLKAFTDEASSVAGYRAMAQLALAAASSSPLEKLTAYRALADDTAQPDWLRGIGALNAAVILLETSPADGKAQLELLAQVQAGTPPLPTVALALELLALDAMRNNLPNIAKAYTQRLLQLQDPTQGGYLTPAMRQRALQRLGALGGA